MDYRKDIQILRGVAVLLVVFFHLDLAGFSSGFLGVDVFFVISGYLMAVMYDPLKKSEFFIKRAKRLLPAYFAVVIVTLLLAVVVTTPNEYSQVSSQATFATFFASNIGFWLENSYFDKAAFKPLLHLWSLAVEIQFYIFVPALYWVFKKARISYLLILVASALLCFVIVGVSPKTSFFWMPLRLWEFLIGYGVAKYIYKGRSGRKEAWTWLGAASLVAIVCIPFIRIDGQVLGFMRGHPGLISLLISLATAGTLAFGLPEKLETNPLSALLEKVGGYSYSIYLAHFPVIVLFLYKPFAGTVIKAENLNQTLMLVALVVVASALLFTLVERPFRKKNKLARWTFAAGLAVLAISPIGNLLQKAMLPANEMLVYEAWSDRASYRCGKIARVINPKAVTCELTDPLAAPLHRVLLVGNSHADSIKQTFLSVAQSKNVSVWFMVENNPLMARGITPLGLMKEAKARNADAIVLHYSPQTLENGVLDELAILSKEANIKVSFIMPVPVWEEHVPMMIVKSLHGGKPLPNVSINNYQSFNSNLIESTAKLPSLALYQVADVFCKPVCQLVSVDGAPLYFDSGHLTLTGSEMLRGLFSRVIDDMHGRAKKNL